MRPRTMRMLITFAAVTAALGAALSGVGASIDRTIGPLRFAMLRHAASGKVVVVELDAASVASIKRWPWPRDNYAMVVDRLRAAGASTISFDVDLSSPATPDGDAAFAKALHRAGGMVALPTFSQQLRSGDARTVDAMPLPMFRPSVTSASVSIAPDADGLVRRAPFGTITGGLARPSLSAFTAGVSGTADAFFPVDYSIAPATIPRLSFIDVRSGHFDPRTVRGKAIVIGATAIELGDRYATPSWGVIPGVVIQALASETLRAGIPRETGGLFALLAAATLALVILWGRRIAVRATAAIMGVPTLLAGAIVVQSAWHLIVPVGSALVLVTLAALGLGAEAVIERFRRQRMTDEVTGLASRSALLATIPQTRLGVLVVANWESLIVVLGEQAEGALMLRLAERVALCARDGTVYRIADRMLAFVPTLGDEEEDALSGLRTVLLQPVEVLGRRVDASVALGLAEGPTSAAMNEATLAAETAIRDGVFWRRAVTDHDSLERDVSLMGELDDALSRDDLTVHYQPKLHLASDRIVSCEALIRWNHPVRGAVRPDVFIPLAEQTDRIKALTLFVLCRAIADLTHWRAAGHALTVAVNISARLLTTPRFNDAVATLVAGASIPADALVFEVTESAAMHDPEGAARVLSRYRDLGIAISMDDYGTGQSTLSYLRNLPLTELKIDRSFVQHAHENRKDALMVRSTIDLAHAIGLKVVAEGVEDEACLQFLRDADCDMAQGYHISRPVPAATLLDLLPVTSLAA